MKLPKAYNPKEVESKIYQLWQKSSFFNPDKLPPRHKKPYTIVLPPPNVTGTLHLGHALNATIQDILIRWRRLQGYKTLWLPGTDHAGIATQNVVEKDLKKEGKTRFGLGKEKFLERIWQWVEKYGDIILGQFEKLGCSLDWSRTRFTLDKEYSKAVRTAFLHYYKKGWIYKGKRPINWCPRCQTSLSDLEIEYKEEKGKLWHIKYPLVKKSEIRNSKFETNPKSEIRNSKFRDEIAVVVVTTRPETMFGDTAVAVNPKDERYKKLVGEKVILPLANREIPIVADKLVDPKFGTGAVKVTPGHHLTDYEISLRHNLPMVQVIDEEGKMTKEVSLVYQGVKALEAREKIVEDLKKLELLEKVEEHSLFLPKCYRCDTTLEILPSEQWFLKMSNLAKMAEKAVKRGKIRFHPRRFEKSYFDWLKNIKDWCISRQLWWGHTLPIWRCQIGKKSKILENWKLKIRNSSADTCYVVSPIKPKCPFCGKCEMQQSADVLDTWFSSALWPFATLGWPGKSKNLKRFYPTDVLVTGRDIINLWVTRMIFSGIELLKKIPFKEVYIHATILTKEGKRMSKSLGTGVNPLDLIEKYGADATRWGIGWQIMEGQDIRFVEDNIVMGKKFCNKIWNASRFVLLQIPNSKFQIPNKFQFPNSRLMTADKKVLKALEKTIKSVNKDLENFQFGKATHTLYNFFWHDFCDIYIEEAKKQLSEKLDARIIINTKRVLIYVLLNSLKLLHPFIPFITEEIYQKLPIKGKKKCLMIEQWPSHQLTLAKTKN